MRNHHRTILENILAIFASTTVSRAVKLLLIIVAARIFGAEDYGRFAYVMVMTSLTAIFMDLGITSFIVQQLARDQSRSAIYLGQSIIISFISGVFLIGLLYIYFNMFDPRPDMADIGLVLGLSVLFNSLTNSFNTIFQSQQKMVRQSWVIAITNIITSLLGFLILFIVPDLILFAATILLASLIRLVVSWRLVVNYFNIIPKFEPSKQTAMYLFKGGWPFLLTSTFIYVYYQIDTIFLEYYWNSSIVGYYNAAYRLVEVPISISAIIRTALFPAISKLYGSNKKQMEITISKTFNIAIVLSFPVTISVFALADQIVLLIYGQKFEPAVIALRILILGVAVIFPSTILGTSLRAMGLQLYPMWITGIGALLNIILNYCFIPRYGLAGAAWTTFATEILIVSAYILLLLRRNENILHFKNISLIITINLLLVAFFYMTSGAPMLITAPIAILLYSISIQVTGLLRFTDIKKLRDQKL